VSTLARNRGTCPVCGRDVSLNDDRSLRAHNQRAHRVRGLTPEPCPGSGRQPLDQGRLDELEDGAFDNAAAAE
jgi:hypothetical protein